MPSPTQVAGLTELIKKLSAMQNGFNGPAINTACMDSAKLVAKEVRRNLKRGPTGNLLKSVQAVRGKRAWKYGSLAIARINAWFAPHAHLIEAGTKSYAGVMKIPLSAVSPEWWMKLTTAQRIQAGKRGYIFITKRDGAPAQHPFQRAVESTLGAVSQLMRNACQKIAEDATK